ncbi:MAG: phytanoyl-CoA dioxygenase family protein [Alphaproteobacteria bacterium]|nr:phytanoyl-CoA dioxygenase family protein [Alphaproteobacteria bacterium]
MQTLTDRQWQDWRTAGYFKVDGALSPAQVDRFSARLDEVRLRPGYEPLSGKLPRGHYGWVEHCADTRPEGFMDRRDLLSYGQEFIDLIDHAPVFDLIVDLMGPYIAFSMSQAIVRPSNDGFPGYTHTDGGEGQREVRVLESSRPIAVKALYLLTDVEGRNNGNFTVYPGSHVHQIPFDREPPLGPQSPGCVHLEGKAGDAFIFSHALWHGPAPNESGRARKTLLYNYTQMFMRAYDYDGVHPLAQRGTPRQRRLMGDLGYDFRPGSYFYVPDDQVDLITDNSAQV